MPVYGIPIPGVYPAPVQRRTHHSIQSFPAFPYSKVREAPGKSFGRVSFRELWALFTPPIGDAMLFEDRFDSGSGTIEAAGPYDLCIRIFGV